MKLVEQKAIETHFSQLVECISPSVTQFLSFLRQKQIINVDDREILDSKITSRHRTNTLLEMLKTKDTGWSGLMCYLQTNDYQMTAQELTAFLEKEEELKCLSKEATDLTKADNSDECSNSNETISNGTVDSNGPTESDSVGCGLASDTLIATQAVDDISIPSAFNDEPDKKVTWDNNLGVCEVDVQNSIEILAKCKDLERHGKEVEEVVKGLRGSYFDFLDKLREMFS